MGLGRGDRVQRAPGRGVPAAAGRQAGGGAASPGREVSRHSGYGRPAHRLRRGDVQRVRGDSRERGGVRGLLAEDPPDSLRRGQQARAPVLVARQDVRARPPRPAEREHRHAVRRPHGRRGGRPGEDPGRDARPSQRHVRRLQPAPARFGVVAGRGPVHEGLGVRGLRPRGLPGGSGRQGRALLAQAARAYAARPRRGGRVRPGRRGHRLHLARQAGRRVAGRARRAARARRRGEAREVRRPRGVPEPLRRLPVPPRDGGGPRGVPRPGARRLRDRGARRVQAGALGRAFRARHGPDQAVAVPLRPFRDHVGGPRPLHQARRGLFLPRLDPAGGEPVRGGLLPRAEQRPGREGRRRVRFRLHRERDGRTGRAGGRGRDRVRHRRARGARRARRGRRPRVPARGRALGVPGLRGGGQPQGVVELAFPGRHPRRGHGEDGGFEGEPLEPFPRLHLERRGLPCVRHEGGRPRRRPVPLPDRAGGRRRRTRSPPGEGRRRRA